MRKVVMKALVMVFFSGAFLFTQNSSAQGQASNKAGVLSYGAKFGMAISDFSANLKQNDKVGVAAGGFVGYQVLPFLGVEMDMFYQQEGANQVDPSAIYDGSLLTVNNMKKVNSNVTLNTLHIPLLIKLNPQDMGKVSPKLLLGASYDYIFSATSRDLIVDNNTPNTPIVFPNREINNVTSAFASSNFGAIGGLGIDFFGSDFTYTLEVRYKMGLSTINNLANYNVDNTYKEDFTTNTFQLLLGISF